MATTASFSYSYASCFGLARALPLKRTDNGAYYSAGAWGEATTGGGNHVNESSLKAVAAGLDKQGLLKGISMWQLDDW
jgi:hypothetical protein